MAGTNTITYQEHRTVKKITMDWLSNASGAVSGTATKARSGQILRVVFQPDSGGTQPTDQYDVTLLDDDGMDVLAGVGANLSNAANSQVVPVVTDGNNGNMAPVAFDGTLELQVANAGNAKGGIVIIYYR